MNKQIQRLKNLLSVPTFTWEEDELIQYVVENTKDLQVISTLLKEYVNQIHIIRVLLHT